MTLKSKGALLAQNWYSGAWLSLVERLVRDQEAESSNLSAPILS